MGTKRQNGAGSVRKLPSGKYQANYTGFDGKRRSLGCFEKKTEAEQELRKKLTTVDDGSWQPPVTEQLTVAEFMSEWLEMKELQGRWEPNTAKNYKYLFRQFVSRELPTSKGKINLGATPIRKVTPAQIQLWYGAVIRDCQERRGEGKVGFGTGQAAHSYRHLRTVFNAAVKQEVITRNPCNDPELLQNPNKRDRFAVEWSQLDALGEHMPDDLLAALWLAATACAGRRSEVVALRRSDITINRDDDGVITGGEVHIERAVKDVSGGVIMYGTTKNSGSIRTCPIPVKAARIVAGHLGLFVDEDPNAWLFTHSDGEGMTPNALTKRLGDAATAAGFPQLTTHSLRRGFITEHLRAGTPDTVIMRLAGLKTLAMLAHYDRPLERDHNLAVGNANRALAAIGT